MSHTGWISIHRKLKDHWVFQKDHYFKAWITIIMEVNHQDKKVLIHNELIECNVGQSLNSLQTWTKIFGKNWTIQKTRTFLKLLEKDSMINIEGLPKTTRLSVCNYDSYQNREQTNNTQLTNKQQTNNKQITTNNNVNKENNSIEAFKIPDDKYSKVCEWFHSELKKKDKVKANQNWRTKQWYDSFRLLETSDGVEWESEFKPVMLFYLKSIGKEYCPEAYSPASVRSKWIKLKGYMERENNKNKSDSASYSATDFLN